MLLAINVGNTHIGIGLTDKNGWLARWQLAADIHRTSDELSVLLDLLLEAHRMDCVAITHAAISSVVPAITHGVVEAAARRCGRPPLLLGPGTPTGMEVRYDAPSTLGTDRVATALAARQRHGAPVIVVDFGTATTFNAVDRGGAFAGGAIAPGVGIAADALAAAGARLRRIDLSPADGMAAVGRTTEHSMRSGVIYGYAALVSGLVTRIASELDGRPETVPVTATGGMASLIAPLVPAIGAIEPDLALDGLKLVAELNREVPWATP